MKPDISKIGLIGRVDRNETLFDGQTVKTRMMYRLLCDIYGADAIEVVDTMDWKHNGAKIVKELRHCLKNCDDVVFLLSSNGRKALYPLLVKEATKKGKRVYQNLIGGALIDDVKKHPKWVDYLNAFQVNWVESRSLADDLDAEGVRNARYLPNFKYLDIPEVPRKKTYDSEWRFCTFSRVVEEKGVGDAIRAIEKLNNHDGDRAYFLDVYGPVEDSFSKEFDSLIEGASCSRYRGIIAPEESVDVVKDYDALLFPTKWPAEGIPGTIIDALSAGTPVIAARWPFYSEQLEDGVTGVSYEFGHNELLSAAIESFTALGSARLNSMRSACFERAKMYTPEVVADEIRRTIGDR